MSVFSKKTIAPNKRVCMRLKEAREAKGMTIEDMARELKIRKAYVVAIEACAFEEIPFALVYKKKIIKKYAATLDIDASRILDQFIQEEQGVEHTEKKAVTKPTGLHNKMWYNLPHIFRAIGITAILVGCVGYLGVQIKKIVEPPELLLVSPQPGFITNQNSVRIQGRAETGAALSINGTTIVQNSEGIFNTTIDLQPGVNTITVSAKKKHGKDTTFTRHVVFRDTADAVLSQGTSDGKDI